MEQTDHKTHFYLYIILLIVIGIAVVMFGGYFSEKEEELSPVEQAKIDTKELLKTDPADLSHIGNIKYIQDGLAKYLQAHGNYPADLEDLRPLYVKVVPRQSTEENYLYAYFPKDKPTAYHLGARLGGRNPADVQAFREDADFNSSGKYINGFTGTDPIFDIVEGK